MIERRARRHVRGENEAPSGSDCDGVKVKHFGWRRMRHQGQGSRASVLSFGRVLRDAHAHMPLATPHLDHFPLFTSSIVPRCINNLELYMILSSSALPLQMLQPHPPHWSSSHLVSRSLSFRPTWRGTQWRTSSSPSAASSSAMPGRDYAWIGHGF